MPRRWMPSGVSRAEILAKAPQAQRDAFLASLSAEEKRALLMCWPFWARPKQLPPPDIDPIDEGGSPWRYWLILAGRFWGKSRTAAEWIRSMVVSGQARKIVLAGPVYQDVEKVMIPAIQNAFPEAYRPRYIANKLELRFWPFTFTSPVAEVRSSDKPDGFRGREWDCGWIDEFASFENIEYCWETLLPAMRGIPPGGGVPKLIFTTTPKERKPLYDLIANSRTVLTEGHSEENQKNVAEGVLDAVREVYAGSDLEEQELGGKLLGHDPGALFHRTWFESNRQPSMPSSFKRKIVAVDTSGSGKVDACECGIVVMGLSDDGKTAFLLQDASFRATPEAWAKKMYEVFQQHKADKIIYESNYGGELIPTMFKQLGMPASIFKAVPAKGSKHQRAIPVSALTQKGKIKFVGTFQELEMQCCTWTPRDRKSPDRLDAYVHAVTELFPAIGKVEGQVNVPGFW